MHIENYDKGGIIFPKSETAANSDAIFTQSNTLRGLGGKMFLAGLPVATGKHFNDFTRQMQINENKLIKVLRSI